MLLGDVDFAILFILLQDGTPPGPPETLAAAHEAGAVTVAWGNLINTVISFVVVAFSVFLFVRWINKAKQEAEEAPEETPEPSAEQKSLTEVRDLLAKS